MYPRLKSIKIKGYRPFGDFSASFGPLEVIVGANGSGKSSLFEFLRFLREGVYQNGIPPEIIPDSAGQRIFHSPGPERLLWDIEVDLTRDHSIRYQGELTGPVGNPHVIYESVQTVPPEGETPYLFMEIEEGHGFMQSPDSEEQPIDLAGLNQLALVHATNPAMKVLYDLRDYIRGWRFYNSFYIDHKKIRDPVLAEQKPVLHEDAINLSSVLLYLMSDEPAFEELQQSLRSTIPGFSHLTVKAHGDPGQVMAFCREDGVENELTLADMSDGVRQLICWITLCVQPNRPSLICIDEPTQGLHPRVLPSLTGLLKKASSDTQILLATHSSYFLTLFELSQIAVMRKEDGEAKFIKPTDSKVLTDILEDFGPEEIEALHISDELEYFA